MRRQLEVKQVPQQQEVDPNLAQLLQLAQISHLTSDDSDQKDKIGLALGLLKMQQEQEALQEQARYHTGELAHGDAALAAAERERQSSTQANVMDSIVGHLSQRPDVPLSVIADALEQGGHPELGSALKVAHAKDVQDRAVKMLPAIVAAHQKGDEVYKNVLAATDPEVIAALKDHLPADTSTPIDPTSLGTKLGSGLRNVGAFSVLTNPGVAPYAAGYYGYQTGKNLLNKPGFAQDFWNSLLNKPQPTAP